MKKITLTGFLKAKKLNVLGVTRSKTEELVEVLTLGDEKLDINHIVHEVKSYITELGLKYVEKNTPPWCILRLMKDHRTVGFVNITGSHEGNHCLITVIYL